MKKLLLFSCIAALLLEQLPLIGEERTYLPRKVAALYVEHHYEDLWYSKVLQYAAMPMEQNGLVVEYHNVLKGFPQIKDKPEYIGALVWDLYELNEQQKKEYLDWAAETLEAGKKIVLMETLPGEDFTPSNEQQKKLDSFWNKMGASNQGWEAHTLKIQLLQTNPILLNFERTYMDMKAGFSQMKILSNQVTSHLIAREDFNSSTDSALIFTGPNGSFVASDYGLYRDFYAGRDYVKWYINPFLFFRLAFDTDKLPKPDISTLAGRRIYYSHIDGDGWNSITEVEKYRKENLINAGVILKEIIAPNPSLPVTVGPVGADLDPAWVGIPQAGVIAKQMFSLDHVEMGSHTYSHPFDWGFFRHYSPEREKAFFKGYKYGVWTDNSLFDKVADEIEKADGERQKLLESEFVYPEELKKGYEIPRAYANQPFDLNLEIEGSLKFFDTFAPNPNKKTKLIQWSGNCLPFEAAIKASRVADAFNINGGDTRFDNEYASYAWVRPIGMNVGSELQIFSSMANENLYTKLWTQTFFGFKRLPNTIKNTNTPIRLRPINLYYHTYSGEKLASLEALQQNIEYIKKQEITPIKTTEFSQIAQGFYSTQIYQTAPNAWEITERGALQTIRFDHATFQGVDFASSKGVIGQRHLQGSLYVYLDKSIDRPLIATQTIETSDREPIEETPYLINSRWKVQNLKKEDNSRWSFDSEGFGDGEMTWSVPTNGMYRITTGNNNIIKKSEDHLLQYTITENAIHPLNIKIERMNP